MGKNAGAFHGDNRVQLARAEAEAPPTSSVGQEDEFSLPVDF